MDDGFARQADLFFAGSAQARLLFASLHRALARRFAPLNARVQKTQITYFNRRVFACVSLPAHGRRGRSQESLVVSFGLRHRLDSPRVFLAVEPYPNRWTHHVRVSAPEQIDEELLEWIAQAYHFSMAK